MVLPRGLPSAHFSAKGQAGFFIRPNVSAQGTIPNSINKVMPGIIKSAKGEDWSNDKGISIKLPSGATISDPPPASAPKPRKANKKIKKILPVVFIFGKAGKG